jgi:hypothetical protein
LDAADPRSRPPVEGEASVAGAFDAVAVIVGAVVVPGAEQQSVGEVGAAAGGPGRGGVMGFGLPPVLRTPSQWSKGHGKVSR